MSEVISTPNMSDKDRLYKEYMEQRLLVECLMSSVSMINDQMIKLQHDFNKNEKDIRQKVEADAMIQAFSTFGTFEMSSELKQEIDEYKKRNNQIVLEYKTYSEMIFSVKYQYNEAAQRLNEIYYKLI